MKDTKLPHGPVCGPTGAGRENVSLPGPKGFTPVGGTYGPGHDDRDSAARIRVIAALRAYLTVRAIKPLVVNAIVGVVILAVANAALGVAITPIAVVGCVVGSLPGAILVLLLAYFDVAFAGMIAPVASLALG